MEKKNVKSVVFNTVFAVVMIAVLLCQFLPFWTVGDQTASLLDVSARQYDQYGGCLPLIEALDDILGGFSYTDINTQVLLTIVCAALAVFMAFAGKNGFMKAACAVLCMGFGLWLYFTVPAFSMGVMGYVVLACEAMGVVAGVLVLIDSLKK